MAEGGIRCTREPSRPRTFEGAEVLLLYEPVPISPYARWPSSSLSEATDA